MSSKTLASWMILVAAAAATAATPASAQGGAAAPAPREEGPATGSDDEPEQVPPGTAEDQALWKAGREIASRISLARIKANKMQWQARQARMLERLETLSRQGGAPNAARAAALLERYRPAILHNYTTLTRQWPVDPTRGCGYAALNFEGMLYSSDHPRRANQLAMTREDLQDCVSRAEPAIRVMAASNEQLETLTAEAIAILPPLPVAAPKAPAPAPGM